MSSRGSPMVYPKDLPLSPLSSLSDLASKLNSDPGPGPSIEELVLMAKKPVKATQGLSKKRKAQNQNPAESTSKRHRGKSRKKQNTRVTKSASKSPRKLCCAWPTIPRKDSEFNRQFIQCDGCKAWYHYGCVGIVVGDERLERDETFLCPPCSSKNDKGLLKPSERCRRPDCGYAEQGLDPDEYFVERIVGRKQVGRQQFIWLVKWEGYPISMAEWISGDAMQDHIKLAEQFIDDALAEGIDLVPEDTALLMEARRGGWVT
ncbi:hypothetical protein SERLA73DRAFT_175455 [Serpula lacrymans var. lacrymans S7.3]|uniref:Chromo domain-containing protein n=2 Tax=Serpula lacrymans var. lacrymans TaxID=341189 RepID=F8PJY1_SERL3|nr:uncharacterized protein SERLADRAFT_457730 [Serpula lacrymans var. lacrymans S7.9]EGO03803.1 hypothetical protein SERLA73DRAFT_175455 [Serpula lacrymans var. lacrymans S7.3]EGO29665.1 hypothetical protein SERLADRAFT_457730 [Serpula lacrymans var. lacrymans S7.9]